MDEMLDTEVAPEEVPEPFEGAASYWAAEETESFGQELSTRIDSFYDYVRSSGQLTIWNKAYRCHYQGRADMATIQNGGSQGEQTLLRVNHLRNIDTHIVNQITAQRPAFDAKASNSDYDSYQQTVLAQQLLDFQVMRALRLETVSREAVEKATVYGEGFISKLWDATGGEMTGAHPETGQPIMSGSLAFRAHHAIDVPRDFSQDDWKQQKWCCVRMWENRFDLAAQYPEIADEIMNAAGRWDSYGKHPTVWYVDRLNQKAFSISDEVEVFYFFHARTKALPRGRRCMLVGDTVVPGSDGPLPYRDLPVYRIAAGKQDNTSFGYTINFDLLPIQDAVNALYGTVATNQGTFGIQSIWCQPGSGLNVQQLGTGMQLIESETKPEPLNLTHTSPETYQFLTLLVKDLEALSAVNSVIRGNPEASLKSGSALAMVAAQALQFSVNLQSAYIETLEDVCQGAINDYVDFSDQEQVLLIAGKSNRSYLKSFKGSDLNKVSRVVVDVGNPLSRTLAGRDQMAQQMIQAGLIKTPQEYLQVMAAGRIEPLTEGIQSQNMLIKSENEALAEGRPVIAVATDQHQQHVIEHSSVLASPEARLNDALRQAVLNHINEHIGLMRTTDPALLGILGVPSLAAPPAPPPGPPGPTGKPVPAPESPLLPAQAPNRYAAKMPEMPKPPVNPQTGQRVELPPQAAAPGVKSSR